MLRKYRPSARRFAHAGHCEPSALRYPLCDMILRFHYTRFRGLLRSLATLPAAKANDMDRPTMPVLSLVCTSCRARHIKCSGPPICSRCVRENARCEFRPSRRGQKTPLNQALLGSESGSAASATCVLCRERHLKCSGGPRCSKCESENLPCIFRPSRRGQRKASAQSDSDPVVQDTSEWVYPTPVSAGSGSFDDADSSRSFSYFWEQTSTDLSGDHEQNFWKVFVLQFSSTQPAIKHMLAAIGALHESLDLTSSTAGDDKVGKLQLLAFEHHHAAIQLLKDSAEDLATALVSCILFICFETLQRDFVSTVSVLRSGLQVLAQWRSSTEASRPSTIKAEVVPVICSITRQLSNFVEAAAIGISPQAQCYDSACLTLAPAVELPTTFLNIRHARDSLVAVIDHGYGFVDPVWRTPNHTLTADFDYQTQILLRSWYTRFSGCTFDNAQTQKEAELLKIQYHVACIMTAPLHREGEMLFDDSAEQFETIISLCEHLLELGNVSGDSPSWKPISGEPEELRPGMIPALGLCAMRCRCPRIRRRALAALKSRSWREGFSHSDTAAIIAEKVIDVEEEGLGEPQSCSDIPFSKRIRVLRVDRVTAEYSPTDYQGSFSDVPGIWSVPRARLDTRFAKEPRQVLRYVRYPWNATSPVEEMWLDDAS